MNHTPSSTGLRIVAVFKFVKGVLLLILAAGLLKLVHKDVAALAEQLIDTLRADPDNRYLAALLHKLGLVDDRRLEQLSALTFGYAMLFLTEGTGLFLEKRWAEYLTVIATLSFIPIEIYELAHRFGLVKLLLLVVNIVIAVYLIHIVRTRAKK